MARGADFGLRMRSRDRRELVLRAATRVYGARGPHGATTPAVAAAAGVSQPYVIRMFGGKDALAQAVIERAMTTLLDALRIAVAELPPDAGSDGRVRALGRAWAGLAAEPGLLPAIVHAWLAIDEPAIARAARHGLDEVTRLLRDAGLPAGAIAGVIAHGMLLAVAGGPSAPLVPAAASAQLEVLARGAAS